MTFRLHLREFAGAVVLVSHDPVDAAVLADEIAILDRGGFDTTRDGQRRVGSAAISICG